MNSITDTAPLTVESRTAAPAQEVLAPRKWTLEKHSEAIYRLSTPEGVHGYVERAGAVWVALEGARLDRCVEIGQSLSLERALAMLTPAR